MNQPAIRRALGRVHAIALTLTLAGGNGLVRKLRATPMPEALGL